MFRSPARIGLVAAIALGTCHGAGAVTLEVARACDAMAAKQFPPRQIGNPAAGSSKGTVQERRAYYSKCVQNGGKVDDAPAGPAADVKSAK